MLSKTLIANFLYILTYIYAISSDTYRLPVFLTPKHYTLKISVMLGEENRYHGTVEIVTECINVTRKITLHRSLRTTINKIEVRKTISHDSPDAYETVNLSDVLYRPKDEFLWISTETELEYKKEYVLYFEIEGQITVSTYGISRIIPDDNHSGNLAYTNFEPQGARQVFPCFDEPNLTATFQIIIGREASFKASSNMPLVKSEADDERSGWYWDYFMHSDTMSTYLVSFVVYDTESYVWLGRPNARMHILVRTKMREKFDMVATTAPKLLIFIEQYLSKTFPFPKLDFVAVPKVAIQTISNPGLVIFHENTLIYDSINMKQEKVQRILVDVAQSTLNQFLSILSIDWWSNYWFKYSLETYGAQLILDKMSDGKSSELVLVNDIFEFLNYRENSSPPPAITADFQTVETELGRIKADGKNRLLLRTAMMMLEKVDVKEILTGFIKRNAFQTVNEEQFFQVFENSAKDDFVRSSLNKVFHSWKNQSGYPLLKVIRTYDNNTANVNQEHPTNSCWYIPINYQTQSEYFEQFILRNLMECPNKTLIINDVKSTDWILLNNHLGSIYRVDYDETNWNLLSTTLHDRDNFQKIPALNRMSLIDDAFTFTNHGNMTYDFLFQLLDYSKFEQSYAPWAAISRNVLDLHWKISGNSEALRLFNTYMQGLVRALFRQQKLDIEENDLINSLQRRIIIDCSCFFGLKNCLVRVNEYFKDFKKYRDSPENGGALISPEIRDIVYCYAVKNGGREQFEFLLKEFKDTNNLFERENILKGLFCTKDFTALEKISEVIQKNNKISHGQGHEKFKFQIMRSLKEIVETTTIFPENETTTLTTTSSEEENSTETATSSSDEESTTEAEIFDEKPETTTAPPTEQPELHFAYDLDLENIFLRSQFDIADSIFYSQIVKIDPNSAPRFIALFTERIREKKDLDRYKLFVRDQPKVPERIRKFMQDRIEIIEANLKNQRENTDKVVRALRKYLKIERKSSAASIAARKTLILYSFLVFKFS